jgi:hypothetical protein
MSEKQSKSREETPEEKLSRDQYWRSLGKKVRNGARLILHAPGPVN